MVSIVKLYFNVIDHQLPTNGYPLQFKFIPFNSNLSKNGSTRERLFCGATLGNGLMKRLQNLVAKHNFIYRPNDFNIFIYRMEKSIHNFSHSLIPYFILSIDGIFSESLMVTKKIKSDMFPYLCFARRSTLFKVNLSSTIYLFYVFLQNSCFNFFFFSCSLFIVEKEIAQFVFMLSRQN
ncbi:hypothetical protein BLOT_009490 [Blomia tropicalis]|nr:hypothetical protein BLOT_009490 [Blomia tropicalis]